MANAKHWCFTLNNYDEAELDALRESLQAEAQYAIFGKEVAPSTGTPHLQGYVCFRQKKRIGPVKKLVGPRSHVEACKGSPEDNIRYCSKGDDIWSCGEAPLREPGKRSDLEAFKQAVKDGQLDRHVLMEEHSLVFAKYRRFCDDYIRLNTPSVVPKMHALYDWQGDIYNKLKLKPDDRKVIFVVDKVGNSGKSWFAKYYCHLHDNACLMRPGKHADMAYLIPETLRVLFLDCTRKQVEFLPYTFIEEVKDGYVQSTKYESCIKKYDGVHVVVLMNEHPDMGALSSDRYEVVILN